MREAISNWKLELIGITFLMFSFKKLLFYGIVHLFSLWLFFTGSYVNSALESIGAKIYCSSQKS